MQSLLKTIKYLSIVILLIFTGCSTVNTDKDIILEKTTVFGLEIAEPTGRTKLRFGLVRYFYQKIPTSTNGPIFSPIYSSSVDSTLGFSEQKVKENFVIGNTNVTKNNE